MHVKDITVQNHEYVQFKRKMNLSFTFLNCYTARQNIWDTVDSLFPDVVVISNLTETDQFSQGGTQLFFVFWWVCTARVSKSRVYGAGFP